ncbi:hypothetical protein MKX03_015273 [Papaver bracteatum]|nr:hypothetical protein MKX03_015273 [Papaver bracteatum]
MGDISIISFCPWTCKVINQLSPIYLPYIFQWYLILGQAFQWFSEVVTYSRPKMKVCMLGDAQHVEDAQKIGIEYMDFEGLNKLNKNKKLVKRLAKKFRTFLASEAVIKQIPRLLRPSLNKAGMFFYLELCKFPTLVTHQESLEAKVNGNKVMVKFQLKKVLCMGVVVGNFGMEEKRIFQNVRLSEK